MDNKFKPETLYVQAGWQPKKGEPRVLPTYRDTAFRYETSEQMAKLFDLEENDHFYTRPQNPTNEAVTTRIAALEDGVAAMLTSSGQATSFFAFFNIYEAGDHIVSATSIYGGACDLLAVTLKKLRIEYAFVDQDASEEEISKAFRPSTKAMLDEMVSNLGVMILDVEKFARIARDHGIPLTVDNIFATPANCRPFEWGADIVTHPTTKCVDGHTTSVSGCIVDNNNFDWEARAEESPGLCQPDPSYHGLAYTKVFGKLALITKAASQLVRDLGAIQSPQNASLSNLGLETLHLRVPQHCEDASAIAQWLQKCDKAAWIHYPELEGNPYHELAKEYLPSDSCGVLSSGLKGGREVTIKFMDSLKLAAIVAHVADTRICVFHPASHTHRQLSGKQLIEAGVAPDLIRFSVDIENADDIIADIEQALNK